MGAVSSIGLEPMASSMANRCPAVPPGRGLLMDPLRAISIGLRNASRISGRAGRAEFWWFTSLWLPLALWLPTLIPPAVLGGRPATAMLLIRLVLSLPVLTAAARRANDAGYSHIWVGGGFGGLFFGLGLFDIPHFAPPGTTGWMPVVGACIVAIASLTLIFVFTRPSQNDSNLHEVPQ